MTVKKSRLTFLNDRNNICFLFLDIVRNQMNYWPSSDDLVDIMYYVQFDYHVDSILDKNQNNGQIGGV